MEEESRRGACTESLWRGRFRVSFMRVLSFGGRNCRIRFYKFTDFFLFINMSCEAISSLENVFGHVEVIRALLLK